MKKLLIPALISLLTLFTFGCAPKDVVSQKTPSGQQIPTKQPAEAVVKEFQPNLGGIKLGDSREKVIQAFGSDYKLTTFDDDFSLGEPFEKLQYKNGTVVVVGLNSKSVLEIEANSAAVSNNLSVKIGDKAQEVLDSYRSKYKEPYSNQGDGKLIGWFIINDQQQLIIFNFQKGESLGNIDVKPDSSLERIKLTNFKYMD